MTEHPFSLADGLQWLRDIDRLLLRHQQLWRSNSQPPADTRYQPLYAHLSQYSTSEIAQLQGDDPQLLLALSPAFADAAAISDIISLFPAPAAAPQHEPPAGVPGRKWQQLQAFCAAQPRLSGEVIEWCAGKGYLGEALCQHRAHAPQAITALEVDPTLVTAGNQRAQRLLQPRRSEACDVFSDAAEAFIHQHSSVLGLHACGGLHQRMLTLSTQRQAAAVALAPCCYHRFSERYQTLSNAASQSALQLSNDDLRLAVRQTKTARRGETLARRQLQRWWLACRQLAAEQGVKFQHYRSLPHSAAKLGFEHFVAQQCAASALPGLSLDRAEAALQRAAEQQLQDEQRGLAAMMFRRLLELRCVLDSALFLREQGYQVQLQAFCPSELSPRNLLITAQRPS